MSNVQRSRASNTYTETQWAALMASVSARRAFSRGAFALVIADADGAFVGLYQKGQSGSAVGAFVLVAPVASGPPLSDATPAALGVAAPGTSPDAARGDHVHLLPPSIAAAQATADAAVPQTRTVAGAALSGDISTATIAAALGLGTVTATGATASAARAALFDRTISIPGLTPSNGNGTAVPATGTLSYKNGQTGLLYADFPRLLGPHGTSIWAFDASARITVTGAPSNQTATSLAVGTTGSVYNAVVMFRLFGDGGIDGLDLGGAPIFSAYAPGTVPVDGTGWLRVRVEAGVMSFFTGVGATYATAAWTIRYRALLSSPPSADTTYPSLALALYQAVDPGVPGVQAVFSDLTIRDLP